MWCSFSLIVVFWFMDLPGCQTHYFPSWHYWGTINAKYKMYYSCSGSCCLLVSCRLMWWNHVCACILRCLSSPVAGASVSPTVWVLPEWWASVAAFHATVPARAPVEPPVRQRSQRPPHLRLHRGPAAGHLQPGRGRDDGDGGCVCVCVCVYIFNTTFSCHIWSSVLIIVKESCTCYWQ